MTAAMAAARSGTAARTSPASQRLRDLPVWDRRTASPRCFCSAVREEMPWTPMSSSAALTPIQAPGPPTLCMERSEGAAGRKGKNGMHVRSEGLTSSSCSTTLPMDGEKEKGSDALLKPLLNQMFGAGACWMVLLEQDGVEALLSQDVLTRRTQRHVWDEREHDGLVPMMTAANVGAPSRPLFPRTRAGTARATPPLNAVHPSDDVQVILIDSPPAGINTCNVDMPNAEISTLVYLYRQDLFSHHQVQNRKLLYSLMNFKATKMQHDICKLPWVLCTRYTSHASLAILT